MSEHIDTIIATLRERIARAGGIEKSFKFVLDDSSTVILVDDAGVREEDGEVAASIHTKAETLASIFEGTLNPMMAFMSGKVRIEGDNSVAMGLKDILT